MASSGSFQALVRVDVLHCDLSDSKSDDSATEFPTYSSTVYVIYFASPHIPSLSPMFSLLDCINLGILWPNRTRYPRRGICETTRSNLVQSILRLSSSWLSALVQLLPRVLPLLAPCDCDFHSLGCGHWAHEWIRPCTGFGI